MSDVDTTVNAIKELHRQRQDLLNSENSLNLRVEANYRRFTAFWAQEHNVPASICSKPTGMTQQERKRYERTLAGGLTSFETQIQSAPGEQPDDSGEDGQRCPDALTVCAYLAAIVRAESFSLPIIIARNQLHHERMVREKQLEKRAKQLPVWPWAESVRGLGALSLAQIIGETGNLSNYANPAKVWKRMGLAVIQGQRQRKTTDKELAIEMGYNPRRRSVIWIVGDNLIRTTNPEYKAFYNAEKERLAEKWPEAPDAHLHKAAHRHMEKRFLVDLWREWNRSESDNQTVSEPLTAAA